tara:strand:- start:440 stop:1195 length:756 start_codon:yes stop_codon:yes gene_type:complete
MKILSYNINGIRAVIKKGFIKWLKKENPDILCLQEIKANTDQFNVHEFEELGYYCFWHSAKKKGYSGVAILSKIKPQKVIYGCGIKKIDEEGRILGLELNNIIIFSCYFPSGTSGESRQNFKMFFLENFYKFISSQKQKKHILACGDYNICHKPIDIHDPVRNKYSSGFLPEERDWMTSFLELGFIDTFRLLNKDPHNYSWFSYRAKSRLRNKGWRIDYHMLSAELVNIVKESQIITDVTYSDHCPIVLKI